MRAKDGLRKKRSETAYGTVTEEKLRSALESDAKKDKIVVGRSRKFSVHIMLRF